MCLLVNKHNRIVGICKVSAFVSVQQDQMNHSEHSCTFSPVWVIMWLLKCPDWPNDLPHSLHYGRACAFSESQPHQMTCCIGHNCMLFLCCEWLCASSDLLLDWMTYGILNTCASCLHSWQAYVSPFWICFAQIRNIQHRGDWQTRSSGLDWIGFTSGYRVSTALRIYDLKKFFIFFKKHLMQRLLLFLWFCWIS